jgi:two-component system phosphate regulon sensor histidine kinase PhoR
MSALADRTFLHQLSRLLDDGMLLVDRNQRIMMANTAAIRFLGDNLVGRNLGDLLSYKDIKQEFSLCLDMAGPVEFVSGTNRDHIRQFRVRMRVIDDETVAILIMDMTLLHNLEKVRRDFVANVSHELRSPLTSLIGFIETMRASPDLDEAAQRRFLKIMDEESKRMSRLINDLMSLSRVETDEHIPPTDIIFIDSVARSVIASLADRAERAGCSILFSDRRKSTTEGVRIQGETDEIMEVFHNLLDNAIKYGHKGSDVIVRMSENSEGMIVFDVVNIGDGIPEKYIPRLTERFFRVDKGRSRQMGGTGLGLAIVKHIINRHRGYLDITSQPGGETVFSVALPLALTD